MSYSIWVITISVALSKYFGDLWEFLFLFTDKFFGYRKHNIYGNQIDEFVKLINYASTWDNKPTAWVASRSFIGYIIQEDESSSKQLQVFCHNSLYLQLTKNKIKKINLFPRSGSFWNLRYVEKLYEPKFESITHDQETAVNKILEIYKEKSYCSALLFGLPNTGKSKTIDYLARAMLVDSSVDSINSNSEEITNVNIVTDWNPTDPNDSFNSMLYYLTPSKKSPLIVVIEEVDILITKFHTNEVKLPHAPMPIEIKNKRDWNTFLDRINSNYYPHVIFVATTNESIAYLDNMDPSYVRDGRILIKHEFKDVINQ